MSTGYNYQSTNCSIPLIVPTESVVFAEQSLFNLLSVLSAALAEPSGLVCLSDIRSAIRFASRILPSGRLDDDLHRAGVYVYDDSED